MYLDCRRRHPKFENFLGPRPPTRGGLTSSYSLPCNTSSIASSASPTHFNFLHGRDLPLSKILDPPVPGFSAVRISLHAFSPARKKTVTSRPALKYFTGFLWNTGYSIRAAPYILHPKWTISPLSGEHPRAVCSEPAFWGHSQLAACCWLSHKQNTAGETARAFSKAGPVLRNGLPTTVWSAPSLDTFKR